MVVGRALSKNTCRIYGVNLPAWQAGTVCDHSPPGICHPTNTAGHFPPQTVPPGHYDILKCVLALPLEFVLRFITEHCLRLFNIIWF